MLVHCFARNVCLRFSIQHQSSGNGNSPSARLADASLARCAATQVLSSGIHAYYTLMHAYHLQVQLLIAGCFTAGQLAQDTTDLLSAALCNSPMHRCIDLCNLLPNFLSDTVVLAISLALSVSLSAERGFLRVRPSTCPLFHRPDPPRADHAAPRHPARAAAAADR